MILRGFQRFYDRFPNEKRSELVRIRKAIVKVLVNRVIRNRPIIIDNFGTISVWLSDKLVELPNRNTGKRHKRYIMQTRFIIDPIFSVYMRNKVIWNNIRKKAKMLFDKMKEEVEKKSGKKNG